MNLMKRLAVVALVAAPAAVAYGCRTGQTPAETAARQFVVASGEDVITAMHTRYVNSWYSTLRFRQKVVRPPAANGTQPPDEIWLEHGEVPGKLRIDQGTNFNGVGTMYINDSVYSFRPNAPVRRSKGRNALLILGFDVYRQPLERSFAVLREEGFDLTRFRTDTWQGRPVYVVGAEAGDLHTKQFWIDQERLVFVRMLNPAGPGGTATAEVRFDRYEPFGGTWISPYVVFLRDGKETMREEYYDMQANPKIPAGLFDPDQWDKVRPN